MRSLLRGERPIIRSDGKPLRDYLYISDAVQAYVRLAEALLDGDAAGEAYNFGTGEPVSVLDIFNEMVEVAGRPDLKPEVRGEASRELRDQFLSSAKAQRELGWRAQVAEDELEQAASASVPYLNASHQGTYEDGETYTLLANVGWGLAGAAALSSVVLFSLHLAGVGEAGEQVQVAPATDGKAAGATLIWRF